MCGGARTTTYDPPLTNIDKRIDQRSEESYLQEYTSKKIKVDIDKEDRHVLKKFTRKLNTSHMAAKWLPHMLPNRLNRIPLDAGKQHQSCVQIQKIKKQQGRWCESVLRQVQQAQFPRIPRERKKKTESITD